MSDGHYRESSEEKEQSADEEERPSASRSHSKSRSRSSASKSKSRSRSYSRSRSHSPGRRPRYRSSGKRKSYSRSRSTSPHYKGGRRGRSTSHSPLSNRKRHVGNRDDPTPSRCLGVFGISLYTTERDIRPVFEKYGPVEAIQIVYDHQTGRSRGFGFVYYEDVKDAEVAKERTSGIELDGRRIRVDYSITKRAHTPTPGIYMGKAGQHSEDSRDGRDSRDSRDNRDGRESRDYREPRRRRYNDYDDRRDYDYRGGRDYYRDDRDYYRGSGGGYYRSRSRSYSPRRY